MMISMICLVVQLPIMVFADGSDKPDPVYNFVVVWLPLILMGIWFIYIVKVYRKQRKRSDEYMAKTEQLLERIATSLEKNSK
jgi:hypothetical protein